MAPCNGSANGSPTIDFEMTREDFIAVFRELYRRRARGEFDSVLALFHEDAIYRLLGSRALIPAAGVRVGKDEIRESWRAFDVDFEIVAIDVEDFVEDLPRMCHVSWRMTLRNRGTGALAEVDGVDRLRWRDYRIAEMTRYLDTALVAALAQTDGHAES